MGSGSERLTILIVSAGSVLLLLAVLLAGRSCLQFYGGEAGGRGKTGGSDAGLQGDGGAGGRADAPPPQGRIEVTVKDGQGGTLEEARVLLYSLGSSLYLEEESDGRGVALLEGVPPGEYSLTGSRGSLITSSPQLITVGAGESRSAALILTEGLTLEGRITASPGGHPAAGACVSATSGWKMSKVACTTTAPDGSFSFSPLAPGRYTIAAAMAGFSTERIHGLKIESGKTVPSVPLVIEKLAAITGRIVTAEGLAVPEAALSVSPVRQFKKKQLVSADSYQDIELPPPMRHPRLIPSGHLGIMKGPVPDFQDVPGVPGAESAASEATMGEEGPCPCMAQAAAGGETSSAASDSSGSFTLRVDPDQAFDLVISHPGYAPKKLSRLKPKDAASSPLEILLDKGREIPGKLTDLKDRAPAGAQLWMELVDFSIISDVPVDSDGTFFLTLASGPVVLHVNAPGYEPERKKIDADLLEPGDMVEIVLVPDRQLLWGRVLDWRGFSVGGAKIIIESAAQGGSTRRTALSDVDGVFSFVTLAPGPWKITIDHPSYFTLEKAAEPWEGEEEFSLLAPGGISGKVVDDRSYLPVNEFKLTLVSEKNGELTAVFESGSYAWTNLPAGQAVIMIEARGYAPQSRQITIPTAEDKLLTTLEDVDFWMVPAE